MRSEKSQGGFFLAGRGGAGGTSTSYFAVVKNQAGVTGSLSNQVCSEALKFGGKKQQ